MPQHHEQVTPEPTRRGRGRNGGSAASDENLSGLARRLLAVIGAGGADGVDGSKQFNSVGLTGDEVAAARHELERDGLIVTVSYPARGGGPGRRRFVSYLPDCAPESEEARVLVRARRRADGPAG